MVRTCFIIILICFALAGCGRKEAANNSEQEDAVQSVSDGATIEDALIKEIQTIGKRDFRKTTWGMDKKTVKLTEPDDPKSEEDSAMIYSRKVAGMDVLIGYIFVEDKLVRAKYMFHPLHDDLNAYITDQNNIKKALEKRYGKSAKERAIWRNELYTNIPSQWGIALGQGYVTFLSLWQTPKTEITVTLKGDNGKIDLWMEYKSKALAKLEQSGGSAETPRKK